MTRLYRGGNKAGAWYSRSREVAEQFFFDRSGFGQLRYVDLPEDVIFMASEKAAKTGRAIKDELAASLTLADRSTSKVIAEFDPVQNKLWQVLE